MATFLALCQATAKESGTVSGDGLPASVTGATGREAKIIAWVQQAWRDIQNERDGWRWMQGEFSSETVSGTQRYTADDMGINERFAAWRGNGEADENRLSCYLTSTGRSDERMLEFWNWDDFFVQFLRGSEAERTGRPGYWTIAPDDRLVFAPTPDDAYTIRGLYRKDLQPLTGNDDVPEMPVRFHDLIKWKALIHLANHDESINQNPLWRLEYTRMMSELSRDALPKIRFAQATLA